MDLDQVHYHATHDGKSGRILIMELKGPNEETNRGQWRTLEGFVGISEKLDAWALRWRADDQIDFFDIRRSRVIEIIAHDECRRRFDCWWKQVQWLVDASTVPTRYKQPHGCKHKPEFIENGRCRICAAMQVAS